MSIPIQISLHTEERLGDNCLGIVRVSENDYKIPIMLKSPHRIEIDQYTLYKGKDGHYVRKTGMNLLIFSKSISE
jgi:hypothetical protein